VVDVIRKADRDRLLGLAGESAFFSVLTLFPALLVAAAVLGQLGSFIGQDAARQVEDAVLEFLDRLLTDAARPAVRTVGGLFDGSGNLLTFASALALASLSTAFATLVNTLTIAYGVPETRGWWRRRWIGLVLGLGSVLTGALAVTLLVLGPVFGSGVDVVAQVGLDDTYRTLGHVLRWPVAFGSLVLWATTMQHLAPPDRHRWRQDLPGGLLTALLWLAASAGLNLYLSQVVTASPLLGALGGGLILMTWFYLLCVALLAGGTLNAVLAARRRYRVQQRTLEGRDDLDDDLVENTVEHIESGAPTEPLRLPAPLLQRIRSPRS
jgi:membrane protein